MFTREELLKHYETMVKIRKFDLEAKRAREAGEILGNVHVLCWRGSGCDRRLCMP